MTQLTTTPSAPLTLGDDLTLAAQLTEQIAAAQRGEREILKAGAMGLRLKEIVSAKLAETGEARRGPSAKGKGLEAWLAHFCPSIPGGSLRRYMRIAEAVQKRCSIGAAEELERLLTVPAEKLTAPERAKQMELFETVANKSQTELMTPSDPVGTPALERLTPEQAMFKRRQEVESGVTEIMKHDFFKADAWEMARPEILEPFAQFLRDEADKLAKWCRLSPTQRREILLKRARRAA